MNIVKAAKKYENWLGLHLRIVGPDLRFKHEQMAAALFPFLRATFYRWLQVWPEVCAELERVPHILSVGDLHVENFGTGETPMGGWCGGLTILMKRVCIPTRWIWCGWRRARCWRHGKSVWR